MDTRTELGSFSAEDRADQLCLIDAGVVYAFRPRIQAMLDVSPMPRPVNFTLEQMLALCAQQRMFLWAVTDKDGEPFMFAVTEFVTYPAAFTARICFLVGEQLFRASRQLPKFEAWARRVRAEAIEAQTRPAIAKWVMRHGFIPAAVAIYKPLVTAN